MRVFLRNTKTRLFCAGADRWAVTREQALTFDNVAQATDFAFNENVLEAEIVLRCDLLSREVVMPLLPEWRDLCQPAPVRA